MKKRMVWLVCCLLSLSGIAQNTGDKLIFPDPSRTILIMEGAGNDSTLTLAREMNDGDFKQALIKELDHDFHRSVIKLFQCSRNLAGNNKGPNLLFISGNEGGFSKKGIIVRNENGTNAYPDLYFVDIALDENNYREGDLNIFSHELGHAMMQTIWDNFMGDTNIYINPKMHMSMGITDYQMAIFEGFGEHFQRLAYENIPGYSDLSARPYLSSTNVTTLWHSMIDERMRLSSVVCNDYIWQKISPLISDTLQASHEEKILLHHASPVFNPCKLKNAQQMLSCEGVLATLFYRINTSEQIQENYQDKSFYHAFLLEDIPAGTQVNKIFTPFENVMLKHFMVWKILSGKNLTDKILFVEYLNEWVKAFPSDKEEIARIFLHTTAGATVSKEAAGLYEKMSFYGLAGDAGNFVSSAKKYLEVINNITEKAINNKLKLDSNVGPELWVENPDLNIRWALWEKEPRHHLKVNINTADRYELESFRAIDSLKAAGIISKRNELGFFHSLEEAGFEL